MKGIIYLVESNGLYYVGSTTQKLSRRVRNGHTCLKTPASHGLSKSESDKIYYENNREEIIRRATNYNKSESAKLYRKNRHIYQSSWGGDRQHNNNLLNIDVNIFI